MDSIGLDQTAEYMRRSGRDFYEPLLRDYSVSDLWALWWQVGRALAVSLVKTLALWLSRYRQRNDLYELGPRMLRDIGVTNEQAGREMRKCFWEE